MVTVDDIGDCKGRRVLLRVDFNVPLNSDLQVTEDFRIRAVLPTIRLLTESGARVILITHLGRPDGFDPALSLRPVAEALSAILEKPVPLAPDCVGPQVETVVEQMQDGEVVLLENLRFHRQENENDAEFAMKLAGLADAYVSDAFGCAHRTQASNVGIVDYVEPAYAGLLMKDEITKFVDVVNDPERPMISILGGKTIGEKIDALRHLTKQSDKVFVAGGMGYTFLKAIGIEMGLSPVEEEKLDVARELLQAGGDKIELPYDCVVEKWFGSGSFRGKKHRIGLLRPAPLQEGQEDFRPLLEEAGLKTEGLASDEKAVDIGAVTMTNLQLASNEAKTVIWSGQLGDCTDPISEAGTNTVAGSMVLLESAGAKGIVGMRDLLPLERVRNAIDQIDHVSTGDRAFLRVLEGHRLPGVVTLS